MKSRKKTEERSVLMRILSFTQALFRVYCVYNDFCPYFSCSYPLRSYPYRRCYRPYNRKGKSGFCRDNSNTH